MFKNVKVMKDKKNLRNCHRMEETEGDMMTKCNVGSWMGSWNRKRTLVEKLEKSRCSL